MKKLIEIRMLQKIRAGLLGALLGTLLGIIVLIGGLVSGFSSQTLLAAPSNHAVSAEIEQPGTYATYFLAASDASAAEKTQADAICDGTTDASKMQSAMASNRIIQLSSGTFHLTSTVKINYLTNLTISGSPGTRIERNNTVEALKISYSSNVVVQGIEMYCVDNNQVAFLGIYGSTGVTVQNNVFHDFQEAIMMRTNPVDHIKNTFIKVISNEFYNYHYACVIVGNGAEDVDVNDNVMHDGSIGIGGLLYGVATETIGEHDTGSPSCDRVNIERNHIYNQPLHNAIDMHGGNQVRIVDNQIENVAMDGIYAHMFRIPGFTGMTENTNWTISGNTIKGVTSGIEVSTSDTDATISNVLIDSNTITGWNYYSINVVTGGSGSLITGVTISNNTIGQHAGSYIYALGIECAANASTTSKLEDININHNTIDGTGTVKTNIAVNISNVVNALVESNTITNSGYIGIVVKNCNNAVVNGNSANSGPVGVRLFDGDDVRITNNRIVASYIPIYIDDPNCVRTQVNGNSWQGSGRDMAYAAAISPVIFNNLDKNMAYFVEVNYNPAPAIDHVAVVPVDSSTTASQIQSLSSSGLNSASSISTLSIPVGGMVTFVAQGYDVNNNPVSGLTFTWSVTNPGVGSINSSGLFTAGTATGEYTGLVQAVTSGGAAGTASVSVVDSPFAAVGDLTIAEGQPLQFCLAGAGDNASLTYTASNLPSGSSFDPAARIFSWTPSLSQAGTYNPHFQVSDGFYVAARNVGINVNNVNRAPVLASIGNKTVTAGSTLSFTVSATDPDGDALIYSASNLPSGATFTPSTRTFSWQPASTQKGIYDNVDFRVSDGSLVNAEDITITVTGVNQAPVLASIGNKTVAGGSTLSFTVSATDPDGDALIYSASNLPSGATFTPSTRTFSWQPASIQKGIYDNVDFRVSDGSLINSEDITITVTGINQAPVLALTSNKSGKEGVLLTFVISATDPDGDALTYSASNLPAGAVFDPDSRTFSWTPSYSQSGTYRNVNFRVSDGLLSSSRLITITVANTNQAPVLNAIGDKIVNSGATLSFTLSGSDPDGSTLKYSASSLPKGSSFSSITRTFTWKPTASQAGSYSNVRFQVSDGSLVDYEIITITVVTVNQPPVISAISSKTVKASSRVSFTIRGSDPNGDKLVYSASSLPEGAAFNQTTKTFSWTPNSKQVGSWSIGFQITDGKLTATRYVTIKVTR